MGIFRGTFCLPELLCFSAGNRLRHHTINHKMQRALSQKEAWVLSITQKKHFTQPQGGVVEKKKIRKHFPKEK